MSIAEENASYVKSLLESIDFMDKYPHCANKIYNKLDEIICEKYFNPPVTKNESDKESSHGTIKSLIDSIEYQRIVLDYMESDEFNKLVDNSIYKDVPEARMAIIFGMSIASMMTCKCDQFYVEERKDA